MIETIAKQAIPILIGLVIFGVLVLIHEFGHYAVARKCGILVEEFAIGMGPKLFSFKKGDTIYSIRLFPVGGFCKMLGEDESENDERAFNNKTVLQRIAVIIAGASMNILLAYVIFAGIVFFTGFGVARLSFVAPDSPAEQAGLMVGDRIEKIDGRSIHIYKDLQSTLLNSKGDPMKVVFTRDGAHYEKTITPKNEDGTYILGIKGEGKTGFFLKAVDGYEKAGFLESLSMGFWEIGFWLRETISGVVQLMTFHVEVDQMSGPIGIVSMIGETYQETIKTSVATTVATMLQFAGMLSAAIGVFNLLPVPALDGGRLLFLILEGIRKKPIKPETEGIIHFVGFVLLMFLAVFVAYNDIIKII